jgi:hypothetical protein
MSEMSEKLQVYNIAVNALKGCSEKSGEAAFLLKI